MPKLPPVNWLVVIVLFVSGLLILVVNKTYIENKMVSLILELLGSFLIVAIPVEIIRESLFESVNNDKLKKEIGEIFDEKVKKENDEKFKKEIAELYDEKMQKAEGMRKYKLEYIADELLSSEPHVKDIKNASGVNFISCSQIFDELKPGETLWWHYTYFPGHDRWIKNVESAVQRGAHVIMLILDPDCPNCILRGDELSSDPNFSPTIFQSRQKLFYDDFIRCEKRLKEGNYTGRLEVVCYDGLIGIPCIVKTKNVSNENNPIIAYSSMYLTKPTGINYFHFVWSRGPVCDEIFSYVKQKYERYSTQQKPPAQVPGHEKEHIRAPG